jgi:outer membrane receptor for Fe3+-dicitrate
MDKHNIKPKINYRKKNTLMEKVNKQTIKQTKMIGNKNYITLREMALIANISRSFFTHCVGSIGKPSRRTVFVCYNNSIQFMFIYVQT